MIMVINYGVMVRARVMVMVMGMVRARARVIWLWLWLQLEWDVTRRSPRGAVLSLPVVAHRPEVNLGDTREIHRE